MRLLAALLLVVPLALEAGCAKRVLLKTEPPGATVTLDGEQVGPVGEDGAAVEVPFGVGPVPYEVRRNERVLRGEIPRDDVNLWIVAAGIGAAVCCAPSLATAGACLANPGLAGAGLVCCLSQNPSFCAAALAAPSWLTLPAGALGLGVGLSPLALAFLADEPKPEVTVPAPEPASESEQVPEQAPARAPALSTTGGARAQRGAGEEVAW